MQETLDDDAHLYRAAVEYYRNGATQERIAGLLGVSRATVSRMLAEARMRGIVTITLRDPQSLDLSHLETRLAQHLGLSAAYLVDSVMGASNLSAGLARALTALRMKAGECLLIASGRSIHDAIQGALPQLPGVVVAPTIGGQEEPAPWYQTNELVRTFASRTGSVPHFLFAPAVPSAAMFRLVSRDPSIHRIYDHWNTARAALVGIGYPPAQREELPMFVRGGARELTMAIGDVASRFIDAQGREISFVGHERYVALSLKQLRRIPDRIAIGAGAPRVAPMRAAARAGLITSLITDSDTAEQLLADESS